MLQLAPDANTAAKYLITWLDWYLEMGLGDDGWLDDDPELSDYAESSEEFEEQPNILRAEIDAFMAFP